ncbi:MAG: tetratricopeptide repeat protein [Bryobacteraceae bacterium]
MFFRGKPIWPAVALIVVLTSCSRTADAPITGLPRRIGVLLFENLSSDVSLDWLAVGATSVISSQIASPASIVPVDLPSVRDVASANVSELIYGYYSVAGDEIRFTAQLRNPATLQNERLITASGKLAAGVLPLLDSLARQISPAAHPYGTRNETAARELFLAASAPLPDQAVAHLELALKADPAFAPAYLRKIQLLGSRGDTAGAKAALAAASQHASSFSALERAQITMLAANLGGSPDDRAAALREMAAAAPTDVQALDALARLQITGKKFTDAIGTYQKALKVEPANVVLWNSLAYAQAYAGDSPGALASLEQYRKLAPNDANVDDTLAEIHFLFGRFDQAERSFVEANRRNRSLVNGQELYRAAAAALVGGNVKSAEEHFQGYLALLKGANDPLLAVRQAMWAYQKGDKSALGQLRDVAERKETPPDVAAVAYAQLAIFLLDSDQRGKAAEEVSKGLTRASAAGARNFAGVAGFLAGPKASASEWKARAERAVPGQLAIQRQILGYALLLSKQYEDAIPIWNAAYDEAGLDAMGEAKVLLAYCYRKAGRTAEAVELMKTGVLPPKSLDPGVPALLVPYYLSLRK